jgi:hypothetical protein
VNTGPITKKAAEGRREIGTINLPLILRAHATMAMMVTFRPQRNRADD